MESAWEILERAGVPLGAPRTGKPDLDDRARVAAAVHCVLVRPESLSERERVALAAWLRAWASEFPSSFAATFGENARDVLAKADIGGADPGRYLKLRRIAREDLARVL